MKVIETRKDNRTGKTVNVSWGDNITSDFSVIGSVVNILGDVRDGEAKIAKGNYNPILDRFTTVAIRIEL